MTKSILNWLNGWRTVFVPRENVAAALNLLKKERYPHWYMRNMPGGGISFRMLLDDSRLYLSACTGASGGREHGLPALFHRYRGRWGILAGVLLFAVLVWQSGTVVWEVSVTGNEDLTDEEIVSMLWDYGFGVGTKFGDIDFDRLQNGFLLKTDEIAWIAVNMRGTVAHVEVRENLGSKTRRGTDSKAANLIAAEDGQIVEVRLAGGRAAVQRGDVVRAGDLLIGGVLTIRGEELRYEYSAGEVLAQVNRVIMAEAPITRTENVLTGREFSKKTVRIFGKAIKLFQNSGIEYASYDTIIENRQIYLPVGIALPIWITTETVREMLPETVTVTEEEAFAEAMILYRAQMDALLQDAEILEMETERICTDGVCRIMGHVVCVTDIARTVEIGVH